MRLNKAPLDCFIYTSNSDNLYNFKFLTQREK